MSEAKNATQQVLKNSVHLLLMQAANYALPLLTFPYLVLTVGKEVYGQVLLANSIIAFLITFADFGLNITATEKVSIHRHEGSVLQQVINHTVSLRVAWVALMGTLWLVALLLVPKLHADLWLYASTFLLVPAQVLNPTFYFQGRDNMGTYSRLIIFSKVLYTLLILVVITRPETYWYINPLNAVSTLAANGIGWWLVRKQQGNAWAPRWQWPELQFTRQSWYIMLGQLGQNALGSVYAVIAGFYLPASTYGKFALADRLIWPFHQLMGAGFQATFPQVTKLMDTNRAQAAVFINKLKWSFGLLGVAGVLGTLVSAPYLITFLNKGEPDADATAYLRLLSPLIFFLAVKVPIQQEIFVGGLKQRFAKEIWNTNIFSSIVLLTGIYFFNIQGLILGILATETFLLLKLLNLKKHLLNK